MPKPVGIKTLTFFLLLFLKDVRDYENAANNLGFNKKINLIIEIFL